MSDEDKPHFLRIAATNDPKRIDRRRGLEELQWPLKELAANLIRVTRGAGRPEELGAQCKAVVEAYSSFRAVSGSWPTAAEISDILSIADEVPKGLTPRTREWEEALDEVMLGSLQRAASKILGQNTQARAGESQLFEGLKTLERQREENRQEYRPVAKPPPKPKKALRKARSPAR
ncbi:hypothetical protein REJC140_03846 [Pseudorhizobium endolithicum]|uniref:Uncharacterized protein n=1 Tax=Pseudorhizobium endolithicum TaxID=1191678 RepID=A0ABN7JRS1_9HYPH|nr:hypothetical protein [Pseudorhizobium endolithicum]CAD7044637.1 hypothetical protein REJC140_03846 [Pseudorhizobium endolithicum]